MTCILADIVDNELIVCSDNQLTANGRASVGSKRFDAHGLSFYFAGCESVKSFIVFDSSADKVLSAAETLPFKLYNLALALHQWVAVDKDSRDHNLLVVDPITGRGWEVFHEGSISEMREGKPVAYGDPSALVAYAAVKRCDRRGQVAIEVAVEAVCSINVYCNGFEVTRWSRGL